MDFKDYFYGGISRDLSNARAQKGFVMKQKLAEVNGGTLEGAQIKEKMYLHNLHQIYHCQPVPNKNLSLSIALPEAYKADV